MTSRLPSPECAANGKARGSCDPAFGKWRRERRVVFGRLLSGSSGRQSLLSSASGARGQRLFSRHAVWARGSVFGMSCAELRESTEEKHWRDRSGVGPSAAAASSRVGAVATRRSGLSRRGSSVSVAGPTVVSVAVERIHRNRCRLGRSRARPAFSELASLGSRSLVTVLLHRPRRPATCRVSLPSS